jgi:hypothetical protein
MSTVKSVAATWAIRSRSAVMEGSLDQSFSGQRHVVHVVVHKSCYATRPLNLYAQLVKARRNSE